MRHHGQPITIETLPASHKNLRGTYSGETDDGCPFQIYVNSGQRPAGGHALMRAHIRSLSQGRPMSNSDLYVQHDDIYILIGRHSRKDVRINPNGTYSHGNIHGRTFKDILVNMIGAFSPKPELKAKEEEHSEVDRKVSSPKPF
jgi:hypothetical protein